MGVTVSSVLDITSLPGSSETAWTAVLVFPITELALRPMWQFQHMLEHLLQIILNYVQSIYYIEKIELQEVSYGVLVLHPRC